MTLVKSLMIYNHPLLHTRKCRDLIHNAIAMRLSPTSHANYWSFDEPCEEHRPCCRFRGMS
ncbi:hypothetical protein RHMOL_Rhmol07G0260000 [Rhododendron molle]|uniref:Uncharacterized protein n=1 Tax=Rhododendron molle TaxID=49168 RepID=A0ACC0N4S7_RHOML|nr:hypothetical protein RHMOL_Rhmol07G0260000 [Rhododendron molle]